ncbi:hypothetical protein [Bradyrhizobium sp. CCGB01]|uniref:hypothetical protein n=1 Tax=Bradyrhizobium sp. CCGB01 TaxID=2949634 RepID=UPI0020B349CE|nr:hypothetical protein [Bradyrhizobium sp. CCGB01]MCP3405497.1 hypothetical protein [Bradyrhizobium sp. CCGB01]
MISFIQENDLLIAFSPLRFRLFELDMPTYERLRASNYFALQRRDQNTERCRDADKNGARGLMSDGLFHISTGVIDNVSGAPSGPSAETDALHNASNRIRRDLSSSVMRSGSVHRSIDRSGPPHSTDTSGRSRDA